MRGVLRQKRIGSCVVCSAEFETKSYQANTCSIECWRENRRRRWVHLRFTAGCARCHVIKPLDQYTGPSTPYCRDCFNADRRDRFTADDYRLQNLKKYNLTPDAFNALAEAQGNRCAICRTDDPVTARLANWHVDHDHRCCPGQRSCGKCVRGLLCGNCNVMIGNGQDDPVILRAAADYLARTATFRLAT